MGVGTGCQRRTALCFVVVIGLRSEILRNQFLQTDFTLLNGERNRFYSSTKGKLFRVVSWRKCMVGMFGGVKLGGGRKSWSRGRYVELELENFRKAVPRFTICPSFLTVVYFVSCDWGTGFHRLSPLDCISETHCHRFFFVCLSIRTHKPGYQLDS